MIHTSFLYNNLLIQNYVCCYFSDDCGCPYRFTLFKNKNIISENKKIYFSFLNNVGHTINWGVYFIIKMLTCQYLNDFILLFLLWAGTCATSESENAPYIVSNDHKHIFDF